MGSRRLGRVTALKALYLVDIRVTLDIDEVMSLVKGNITDQSVVEFAQTLVTGTIDNMMAIDEQIKKHTINWELDRMAVIDRNIMRIATFEMMKIPATPINVIIDEAVEIAKEYSTSESGRFVNGVLDKVKEVRQK
jgi:N utilization substance protein B